MKNQTQFLKILDQSNINYILEQDYIVINGDQLINSIIIPDSINQLIVPNLFIKNNDKHESNVYFDFLSVNSQLTKIEFNKIETNNIVINIGNIIQDPTFHTKTIYNSSLKEIVFNDIVSVEAIKINNLKALNHLEIKNKSNFKVKKFFLPYVNLSELTNLPQVVELDISYSTIKNVKNMENLQSLNANNSLLKIVENCPNLIKAECQKTLLTQLVDCNKIEKLDISKTVNLKFINLPNLLELNAQSSNIKNININNKKLKLINIIDTTMSDDFYKQIKENFNNKFNLKCSELEKITETSSIFKKDVGFKFVFFDNIFDFNPEFLKKNNKQSLSVFKAFLKERKATPLMEKLFLNKLDSITEHDLKDLYKKDKYEYGVLYYISSKEGIDFLHQKKYLFNNEKYTNYTYKNNGLKNIIEKYNLLQICEENKNICSNDNVDPNKFKYKKSIF